MPTRLAASARSVWSRAGEGVFAYGGRKKIDGESLLRATDESLADDEDSASAPNGSRAVFGSSYFSAAAAAAVDARRQDGLRPTGIIARRSRREFRGPIRVLSR